MNGFVLAAISPQWIAIAVASAIVAALLVLLLVRREAERKRGENPGPMNEHALIEIPTPPGAAASFLDEPLRGGFAGLGRKAPDQPALGTIVMPKDMRPKQPPQAVSPLLPEANAAGPMPAVAAPLLPEANAAGPPVAVAPPLLPVAPETEPVAAFEPLLPAPPEPPEPPLFKEVAPTEPVRSAGIRPAPLSDILMTTNQQEVDLGDPEVHQMLMDLVTSEITLAEAYRQQGQVLDAILQLTEAEKACTALGDREQAERIKTLMKELQP